jgi:hypothetical protein
MLWSPVPPLTPLAVQMRAVGGHDRKAFAC